MGLKKKIDTASTSQIMSGTPPVTFTFTMSAANPSQSTTIATVAVADDTVGREPCADDDSILVPRPSPSSNTDDDDTPIVERGGVTVMISTQDRLAEQWIESQLAKSWAAHYDWCSRRLIPILADYLLPEFIPIIAEYWLSWIGALAGPLIPELNPYCYPVYPPRLSPQHLITDHNIDDGSVDHERPTVWAIVDSRGFPYASGTKELYSHARHLRARVVYIYDSALLPPEDASTLRPARQ
jgi:hypothetical protein